VDGSSCNLNVHDRTEEDQGKHSIMTDSIHTTSENLTEKKLVLKIRYCCVTKHIINVQRRHREKAPRIKPFLRQLVTGFPPQWPGFEPRSSHVGFVVDKVALGEVFS
jgi:hypothetical protein